MSGNGSGSYYSSNSGGSILPSINPSNIESGSTMFGPGGMVSRSVGGRKSRRGNKRSNKRHSKRRNKRHVWFV
jgi:hypothetical protein